MRAVWATLIAVMALLGPAPLTVAADSSAGPGAFAAYSLLGNAACLEVTVDTGYSFVAEPDAQLPRADAAMDVGGSQALAAPADPGDSVDAAAGLVLPEVAGRISALPAPLNKAGALLVQNPADALLTYPIEHASASYPDPHSPGDQTRTVGGTPDLKVSDPSGTFTIDGSTGRATAGASVAGAQAGGGAALSIPSVGLSAARLASQSALSVTPAGASASVSCTANDLTIAPAGMAPLHIGTLTATITAQRGITGNATASPHLSFAGATLAGHAVDLGPSGLTTPAGRPVPWPALPASPVAVPGTPVTPPTGIQVHGSRTTQQTAQGGNEVTAAITGATLILTTAAPVPNALPPTGVGTTPVVITLKLATVAASAYALANSSSSLGGGFGGAYSGSTGFGSGSYTTNGAGSDTSPASSGALTAEELFGVPVPRWLIVLVATVSEAALLLTLYSAYRRRRLAARAGPPADAFSEEMP